MVTKDVERLFVGTNILIFATNSLSPWHLAATKALQEARQLGVELILSQQILREYLAAATRINILAEGPPFAEILENICIFRNDYTIVEDNSFVLDHLIELLEKTPTSGKQVHDANIVATMQTHGLRHLCTHNVADFQRFSQFIEIVPLVSVT
ncbi:type II toxin-antitoxin system VapC family toxin [candidate division KSB1 bacterium]|nr:type II toxin-antitoxin system VapC family toxin [candidate division KSB1 bacterium]